MICTLLAALRVACSSALKGKARALTLATPALARSPARSIAAASTDLGNSSSFSTSAVSCKPRAVTSSSEAAPISVSSGALPTTELTSTTEALKLLRSQPSHYVMASITGRTFILAPSDLVTVPRLRDVEVGDVLELERIHEVGSRDYTLRAQDPLSTRERGAVALLRRSVHGEGVASLERNLEGLSLSAEAQEALASGALRTSRTSWATRLAPAGLAHVGATLPPSTVRVRAVVVEHTKGKLERITKVKRRKGYKRTVEHKQVYTRLRIEGIVLGGTELA